MTRLDSQQYQLVESVRQLEQAGCVSEKDAPLILDAGSFEQRLYQRAEQLGARLNLKFALAAVGRRVHSLLWLLALLMSAIGAVAAAQAFSIGGIVQQVNFFWLLLVLLGFNTLALLLWLGALLFSSRRLQTGGLGRWLVQINLWLVRYKADPDQLIVRSWLDTNGRGAVGFWRFSLMSHWLWLAYLCGGLACILVMLMARQFSFFWETTLLSPQSFIHATQMLAWLPAQLGFSVPDTQAIVLSQSGQLLSQEQQSLLRYQWSGLLLASILLYGCLPRAVAALIAAVLLRRTSAALSLPLEQPYYIHLRHQLTVAEQSLGVVDADTAVVDPAAKAVKTSPLQRNPCALPAPAVLCALELAPTCHWPPVLLEGDVVAGHAQDRQSQQAVLAAVHKTSLPVVLAVDFWRTPDRGIERYIRQLKGDEGRALTLVLLSAFDLTLDDPESEAAQKLYTWHSVAVAAGVAAEQIVPCQSTEQWRSVL